MHKLKILILLVFTASLSACFETTTYNSITKSSNKYNFGKFLDSITSFPYSALAEQQEHIKNNYKKLNIGMSKSAILNILPPPNAEFFTYQKNGDKEEFENSSWAYYLSRQEYNLGKDSDAVLFLYFNELEQLYWSIPDNIEGLSPLGNPLGAR
jgi:outer membrane protein assembly factor BamE (lipoprotein component of BamABCDE complex)